MSQQMSPAEYGRSLAEGLPPISDEQIEAAARIVAGGDRAEEQAA